MGLIAFAGRLAPGKTDAWRQFDQELRGARRSEYEASRQRLGIKKERAFLQPGPDGDTVIYTFTRHGTPAVTLPILFRELAASQDPFDVWYKRQMKELLGLDFERAGDTPPAEQCLRMGPRRVRPPEPAPTSP